jgi:ribosomal protein S27E
LRGIRHVAKCTRAIVSRGRAPYNWSSESEVPFMALSVQCGQCGKEFRVKDELAGKRVKCSACGQPIAIPAAAGRAVAPAPKGAPAAKGPPAPARAPSAPRSPGLPPPPGSVHDLLDDATVGKLVAPTIVMPGQMLCPNCAKAIPMGAAVCTFCGFDFRAGKTTRVVTEKPRDPRVQKLIAALIALAIMIGVNLLSIGVAAGAMFAFVQFNLVEIGLPWRNLALSLMFLGGVLTVLFQVSLLADAFKEHVLCGLMFLLVPFYSIYFVATRWQVCRKSFFILNASAAMFVVGLFIYGRVPAAEEKPAFPRQSRIAAPASNVAM